MSSDVFMDVEHAAKRLAPETFVASSEDVAKEIERLVKALYDYGRRTASKPFAKKSGPLKALHVDGFDSDQIWEELQLHNKPFTKYLQKQVNYLVKKEEEIDFGLDEPSDDSDEHTGLMSEEMESGSINDTPMDSQMSEGEEEDEDMINEDDIDEEGFGEDVDWENEEDLENEEAEEDDEDDEGTMSTYQRETAERMREIAALEKQNLFDFEHEDLDPNTKLSRYEAERLRQQRKIEAYEQENLSEKPWQLKGEVQGTARPVNSLLAEHVEFDQPSKPPPIITQQTTATLEQIIRQRILDQVFDDVIRKQEEPEKGDYRRRSAELDMEKSSKSLADIYEEEYIKKTTAALNTTKDPKLTELHAEAAKLFKSICMKLDALSNLHYTPLKKREEMDIKKLDVPAITMEEAVPVAVSEANVLAPEEIYEKKEKDVKGESELTREERRKRRREKKAKFKKEKLAKEAKARREAMLHPERKPTIEEAMKEIKSSKNVTIVEDKNKGEKFSTAQAFQQLQARVSGAGMANSAPKNNDKQLKSSHLKL